MGSEEAEKVGHLKEEAEKRKQRLEALKKDTQREEKSGEGGGGEKRKATEQGPESGLGQGLPKPIFRSYHPQDTGLKELKLPKIEPSSVEARVREELAAGAPQELISEIDLANLAPRKVDWDLKRNICKKLDRLEKRTQRAIAELIRERIKSSEVVNVREELNTQSEG